MFVGVTAITFQGAVELMAFLKESENSSEEIEVAEQSGVPATEVNSEEAKDQEEEAKDEVQEEEAEEEVDEIEEETELEESEVEEEFPDEIEISAESEDQEEVIAAEEDVEGNQSNEEEVASIESTAAEASAEEEKEEEKEEEHVEEIAESTDEEELTEISEPAKEESQKEMEVANQEDEIDQETDLEEKDQDLDSNEYGRSSGNIDSNVNSDKEKSVENIDSTENRTQYVSAKATSMEGAIQSSAVGSILKIYSKELREITDAVAKWEEENLRTEEKLKIAKIIKGYSYSPRFRKFMPGIKVFFENSSDRAVKEPVAVKVKYRRNATNEVWSLEERVLPFNKIDKLEKGEQYPKSFVSNQGVESMRHIMPDLEATIYLNGRQFMILKVGEKEVLDWN